MKQRQETDQESNKLVIGEKQPYRGSQLEHAREAAQVGRVEPQVGLDLGLGHGGPGGRLPGGVVLHFRFSSLVGIRNTFANGAEMTKGSKNSLSGT